MHHIIYFSQATKEFTPMELVSLLLGARYKNEELGITGALVYSNGQFMQVLEGEEALVTTLYEQIAQDARHHNVFRLADKAIAERSFVGWSMAFREVAPGEFADLVGFVPPAQWRQLAFGSDTTDALFLERLRELAVSATQA